jgi:tetratricopeptide (TPR) repeat protein
MRRAFLTGILLSLLAAKPVTAAPGIPVENVLLEEAELRLLLAKRNLIRAYQKVEEQIGDGYRADSLRIRQRYQRVLTPLRASERRNRLAAEQRLRTFAALHTAPTYATNALLRLAALRMEDADEAYEESMAAYFKSLEAGKEATEPRKDYGDAITLLRDLLHKYEGAPHRDVAWYLIGYCLTEMGDTSGALGAFRSLLEEKVPGETRTEVLVRVGDYFFDRNQTNDALPYYKQAIEMQGPWLDRALYKWAWSLYKLNRYEEAIASFTRLAEMGQERPDLLDEAMQYLAISYVEGMGYADALTHMTARGGRYFDEALIERIADVLYDSTDYATAISAYTLAMERRPTYAGNLRLAKRVLLAYHQQQLKDESVAARLRFVNQFAPGGAWYEGQAKHTRAEADLWSERILYEYATYHHYRELRDRPESRPLAEHAYRLYLSRFPGKPRAVQMGFYLAEILYDRDDYATALSYYTRVAFSAPDPATDVASRASYNMVLAAREMYRHDKTKLPVLLEVSRRFADLRPTDERTPLVLYHAGRLICDADNGEHCRDKMTELLDLYPESELAVDAVRTVVNSFADAKLFGELAAWADRLLERGHVKDAKTRQYVTDMVGGAMFRDALAQEQNGKATLAAERYLKVYERYPSTPAGQAALFNAAYSYEQGGRYLDALDYFEKLLRLHPQAKFAARAAFRRAKIYENAANFAQAIEAYEMVVNKYARAPEAKDALFNVGAIYALLGRHRDAAISFERHYAIYGAAATEPGHTLLRIAAQWEEAGDKGRAKQMFQSYAKLPKATGQTPYATLRAAMLSEGNERTRLLKLGLKQYEKVTDQTDPGVLASLRFELTELDRARYMRTGLPSDLKRAARVLQQKAESLKKLEAAYTWVVEAGDPEIAVGALYRIGEAYAVFADMLYNAPVPKELNEEEAEIYKMELETQAAPVEEKALAAYRKAEERAIKNGRETKWTALIRRSLYDKPSSVRVLTDNLEPIFAASAHGLRPAAELALADEALQRSDDSLLFNQKELDVAAGRIRSLLLQSVKKQRIFFHEQRPYIDRVNVSEEEQP